MLSKLSEKLKAILFIMIGMAFFLLAGGLVYFFPKDEVLSAQNRAVSNKESIDGLYRNLSPKNGEAPKNETQTQNTQSNWVLYVTGSVNKPGVYTLKEGARVYQLVGAAGGLTSNADEVAVNLAAPLSDGAHLHVPQKGERRREPDIINSVSVNTFAQKSQLLDINTATESELRGLSGIGPTLAQRIIAHREKNGRFKQVADLIDVPGIGGKRLETISPFLTVR